MNKIVEQLVLEKRAAAVPQETPRVLPKQNKMDPYYYPDVRSHALAAGLLAGGATMSPTTAITTGTGTYLGGKIGRGIGTAFGFPNAGALLGEVAGGAGGAYLPVVMKQAAKKEDKTDWKGIASTVATQADRVLPQAPLSAFAGIGAYQGLQHLDEIKDAMHGIINDAGVRIGAPIEKLDAAHKFISEETKPLYAGLGGLGAGYMLGGYTGHYLGEKVNMPAVGQDIGKLIGGAGGALLGYNLAKQASVLAPTLTEKVAGEYGDAAKNFIENLPSNDAVNTGAGALIGHEIGKRFGHKHIGTAVGAGLGYAASGNYGDIADNAVDTMKGIGEGAKALWNKVTN